MLIRYLQAPDLRDGFLATISSLGKTDLDTEDAHRILQDRLRAGILTFVGLVENRIIATASLILEPKFLHNGSWAGRIEDVAVRTSHQGHGYGLQLLHVVIEEAKRRQCYKIVLNCTADLCSFYEQAGFYKHDVGMRIDL